MSEVLSKSPDKSTPSNQVQSEIGNDDDIDWQGTKKNLNASAHHILENNLFCDVEFIVGDEETDKIRAHKLILSVRSAVFCAMFSKKWSDSDEIKVPDVEPHAFKEMLRFIYSDRVKLTLETVTSVIYAAKKYSIVALENMCSDYLFSKLCPANVCNILIQAQFFHMKKLVSDCLSIIAKDTQTAINTEDFLSIDEETLCLVLERSDLRIDELSLFKAVNRWAEAACIKNNCPITSTNKRLYLQNALTFLRFPVIQQKDFCSTVVPSGLLSEAAVISVFLQYNKDSKLDDCIFSRIRRRAFLTVNRFKYEVNGGIFGSVNPYDYHKIKIVTSRQIDLVGIGLYGAADVTYKVEVVIRRFNTSYGTYRDDAVKFSGTYHCSDKIFRIIFPSPYKITTNMSYPDLLMTKIQGQYSTCGCGGVAAKSVSSFGNTAQPVTITISSGGDSVTETNWGSVSDVLSGQIPELLFEP